MTEWDLAHSAIGALKACWQSEALEVRLAPPTGSEERSRLDVFGESIAARFDVEVRRTLSADAAHRMASLPSGEDRRLVVVSERVGAGAADVLRAMGIGYIDAGGNAHIEAPGMVIHVSGQKPAPPSRPVRAFAGEGLRVVFLMLGDSGLASQPYRRLAALSGASNGTVKNTMDDLEGLGYLVRMGRTERRVTRYRDLLDRWATGYAEVLREKLALGRFRSRGAWDAVARWRDLALEPGERWGGEPAAALATDYLRPARLTLYTRASQASVMQRLRVVPSEGESGDVDVIRPPWAAEADGTLGAAFWERAGLVLALGDLRASDDSRNAEVAALIFERVGSGP